MLDEVRLRLDDPGDEDQVVGKPDVGPHRVLVSVARVRRLERQRRHVGLHDDVDDVGQRHVAVMRTLVVAPAQVQSRTIARHALERMVQRGNVHLDALPELRDVEVPVHHVPAHRQVGAVDLQDQARVGHGPVLVAHGVSDGEQVLLEVAVVVVVEEQADDAGRRGSS